MIEGKVIGADNEAEKELFDSINFTNALVLKINQLAKQVNIFILVRFLSYLLSGFLSDQSAFSLNQFYVAV